MNQLGILRGIRDNELELMRTWRNTSTVRDNMFTQHEISREEHLTWWEKTKNRADEKYFMYELAGIPSGITAFVGIDINNKNSDWAMYASPTAPRGTGSKMEFLMLEYAFYTLRLHKLYGDALAFNARVIHLHQKFGFKVEGIFREQHNVNGMFVDAYRVGILATEWQKHRKVIYEKLVVQAGI